MLDIILALLGYIAYHTIAEAMGGASLGKLIFGQTVVREDGSPIDFGAAAIRSALFFVDGLFFGLIGVLQMRKSELRQRLGDTAAHTVVVPRSTVNESQRKSIGITLLAILAGLVVDGFLGFVTVALKLMM